MRSHKSGLGDSCQGTEYRGGGVPSDIVSSQPPTSPSSTPFHFVCRQTSLSSVSVIHITPFLHHFHSIASFQIAEKGRNKQSSNFCGLMQHSFPQLSIPPQKLSILRPNYPSTERRKPCTCLLTAPNSKRSSRSPERQSTHKCAAPRQPSALIYPRNGYPSICSTRADGIPIGIRTISQECSSSSPDNCMLMCRFEVRFLGRAVARTSQVSGRKSGY
jgi:hypothetical protein